MIHQPIKKSIKIVFFNSGAVKCTLPHLSVGESTFPHQVQKPQCATNCTFHFNIFQW